MQRTANKIFHIGLALSFLLVLLPTRLLMAVYTPSVIGYLWIFILFFTLITFIITLINDVRSHAWMNLGKRTALFIITFIIGFVYLIIRAKLNQ